MPGKFYNFDTNTLTYKTENPGLKKRIQSILAFLSLSIFFASVIVLIGFYFYGSPKTKQFQKENRELIIRYHSLEKEFLRIDSYLTEVQKKDDSVYRVIIETDPIEQSIRESGFGGSDKYRKYENLENSALVVSSTKRADVLSKKAEIQLKSFNDVLSLAKEKEKKYSSMPAISPLNKTQIGYISDYYGYRMHPIHKKRLFHSGIDLTAKIGTEIHSPGDGVVEELNYTSSGYGRALIINHGFGFKTLYGHLSKYNVKKGDTISRGDIIAYVGNAGTSSGPHLHYEIIKDGLKIDPFNYFSMNLKLDEYLSITSK
jgi:murein DD-endopeptidase MepM/ murein hydrolase activator NlpD